MDDKPFRELDHSKDLPIVQGEFLSQEAAESDSFEDITRWRYKDRFVGMFKGKYYELYPTGAPYGKPIPDLKSGRTVKTEG